MSIPLHSETGILLSVNTTSSYICDSKFTLAVTYVTVAKDAISDGTVATASLYHCNHAILQLPLLCSNALSLKENPISFTLY